ncbi:hypothetical protein SCP_0801050 [Sparassis crispa]|uniref:Uncharacterized protein n=1 Tax=Sparassis crispa TaxID=139825 RepID=A0A401GTN8_9APHY|nr:hypothetical protein SCP_0801050 [Sparassis crispa]GBE85588.1 hypothetical protein SCP_0801050 [Sparassis crispa]
MIPHLPPELSDRIIDFLWHDWKSLCSCAVVCRTWWHASRYHLFSSMRISRLSTLNAIAKAARSPYFIPPLHWIRSLELVEAHRSPSAVREPLSD